MKHNPDHEDLSDEFPRRKKRYIQCSDRTCGALDCPNCFPVTYREAFCPDDIEESEEQP